MRAFKKKSLEGFKPNLSRHKKEPTDLKTGQFRLSSLKNRKITVWGSETDVLRISQKEKRKGAEQIHEDIILKTSQIWGENMNLHI